MLRAAIVFFILGLVGIVLGATGFAGLSMEIGRMLLFLFLVLAVISFIVSVVSGRKTHINGLIWFTVSSSMLFGIGCTSTNHPSKESLTTPSRESAAAAKEAGAEKVVEVNFAKGGYQLNDSSIRALRALTENARATGQSAEVKILAWADTDYPSSSDEKPSKADRDLADKRLGAIRDYLKEELSVKKVTAYNMAERPNAFERLFNTSDAKTKSIFERAGMTSAEGKSRLGRASHAVVMEVDQQD